MECYEVCQTLLDMTATIHQVTTMANANKLTSRISVYLTESITSSCEWSKSSTQMERLCSLIHLSVLVHSLKKNYRSRLSAPLACLKRERWVELSWLDCYLTTHDLNKTSSLHNSHITKSDTCTMSTFFCLFLSFFSPLLHTAYKHLARCKASNLKLKLKLRNDGQCIGSSADGHSELPTGVYMGT